MENPLLTTLIVTLVGMAVVFATMGLILGSMALLTRLTGDRPRPMPANHHHPEAPAKLGAPPPTYRQAQLRAAAAAVALARAQRNRELEESDAEPFHTPWGDFSRWRQLHPCGRGRVA